MADGTPKLRLGQEVEIDGQRYEVARDQEGRLTLEPAITESIDEVHRLTGGRRMSAAEFEEFFGDIPTDDEG